MGYRKLDMFFFKLEFKVGGEMVFRFFLFLRMLGRIYFSLEGREMGGIERVRVRV